MTGTGRGGFALPAVLWILVLVGAVSAGFLASAQAERRAVAHRVESARARWAARDGMARTLAGLERALATGGAVGHLRSAGDTLHDTGDVLVDGVRVRSVLVDARARLGIDSASAGELVALQVALDLPRGEAERVADAVLDWRDSDDRRRRGGGERSAYRAGGLPTRPANRPFAAVGELRRVLGVTRRLHDRLAPYLTVHGDGRINVNAAPAPVLSTLPGLDEGSARLLVRARAAATFDGPYDVLEALPDEAERSVRGRMEAFSRRAAFGPRHVELVARADPPGPGAPVVVHGLLELEGGRSWKLRRVTTR